MSETNIPEAPPDVAAVVRAALAEDIGSGDLTAQLLPESALARADVITREQCVVCGRPWFDEVFAQVDAAVAISWQVDEGDQVAPDTLLCRISGPARALVTGERAALNFLQLLSGTATRTRRYADALSGTQTRLLDTRKTVPGLRLAQKYAVRAGGGSNHRIGLYDGILIKENHIAAAGSIDAAMAAALRLAAPEQIEIEVESLPEVERAVDAGARRLLLDNFSAAELARARELAPAEGLREASGGYELESLGEAAAAGVDFISVGGLTKHVQAIDLSMRMVFEN